MTSKAPESTTFRFSTADWPEQDRLAIWREAVGRSVIQLDTEPLSDGAFHAEATVHALPGLWLGSKVRRRRRALDSALPDALDLMVVCVESGLTLDAALQRVGSEIALAHPDISKEFGITHMETRVGLSRVDALRNLGQRTGSASLQSLAAMLVQTERFGTSIAQALRVHAESLRVKRQFAAEEQAAKASVKLIFPVVLFIFPTLLSVLAGPAFILLFKSSIFTSSQH